MYFTKPVLAVIKRTIRDLNSRSEMINLFESYNFEPKKDCDIGNKLNLAGSYLDHQNWNDETTANNLLELLTQVILDERESNEYRWPWVQQMINALIKDGYQWNKESKKFIRAENPPQQPKPNKPVEQKPSAENTGEITKKFINEINELDNRSLSALNKFRGLIQPFQEGKDWQSFEVKLFTVLNKENKRIILQGQVILLSESWNAKTGKKISAIDDYFAQVEVSFPIDQLEEFLQNLSSGKILIDKEEYLIRPSFVYPFNISCPWDFPYPMQMLYRLSGNKGFNLFADGADYEIMLHNTKTEWGNLELTCKKKGYANATHLINQFLGGDGIFSPQSTSQIIIYAPIDIYISQIYQIYSGLSVTIRVGPLINRDKVVLKVTPHDRCHPTQIIEFKLSDCKSKDNELYQKDIEIEYNKTGIIRLWYHDVIIEELSLPVKTPMPNQEKKQKIYTKSTAILNMPDGTKPNDITFRFKDRYTVDVLLKDNLFKSNISFDELGFQKQSTGKKKKPEPSILWELLVTMSVNYSDPGWSVKDKSTKGRQQISLLRDKLKQLLNIEDDPIPLNNELRGYRPEIRLEPPKDERHPSYAKANES